MPESFAKRLPKDAPAQLPRGIVVELLIYGMVCIALYLVLVHIDAFDMVYVLSRDHEAWDLDEAILAIASAGLTSFIFVVRRWRIEHKDKLQIEALTKDLHQALKSATAAHKAKSAFLASLNHELRTPLNAISGYAQLIESGFMGPIDERYAGYAKDIRESGEHLLAIVNDILDMTRIEAGKVRLYRENANLFEVTRECFKLLYLRAEKGGIALVNGVPNDLPLINVDVKRLKQIIINLVGNAVKFAPRDSQVSVTACTEGEAVVIKVCDQGIGMDPKDLEHALEPFSQIDSGLSRNHEGAGLGLAIVKYFVELHGGTLAFDTAPGRGTTVIVTLPQTATAGSENEGPTG
ncbi:HAMP domain-containing sensor histidine kinase [Pelagibius sp. 7325]|uniref:sensor histidine kinase n=1 Tax=Pelagibius sp. 7325 TaxID=3131994 RepID=UPI0030EEDEA4